jgi:hypothetical protein
MVFKEGCTWRILGIRGRDLEKTGENCIILLTPVPLGDSNEDEMG